MVSDDADRRFVPYRPPIKLTDYEWSALDALRDFDATLDTVMRQLDLSEDRARHLLKSIARKLELASAL